MPGFKTQYGRRVPDTHDEKQLTKDIHNWELSEMRRKRLARVKNNRLRSAVNHHLENAAAHLASRSESISNLGAAKTKEARAHATRAGNYHDDAAHRHTQAAADLRKQLPQGYAMVFGKLRKINPKAKRTGIAKLKR